MPIYSILHRWTRSTVAVIEAPTYARALEWAARRGLSLIDVDLEGLVLRSAFLARADLRGAGLTSADLSGCYLRKADFRGADLCRARLVHAFLEGADLRQADLREAQLSRADLRGTKLVGADLRGTVITGRDSPEHCATGDGALSPPNYSDGIQGRRATTRGWSSIWPFTRISDLGAGSSSSQVTASVPTGLSVRWRNRCGMATMLPKCSAVWPPMRLRVSTYPDRPNQLTPAIGERVTRSRHRQTFRRLPECSGHVGGRPSSAPLGIYRIPDCPDHPRNLAAPSRDERGSLRFSFHDQCRHVDISSDGEARVPVPPTLLLSIYRFREVATNGNDHHSTFTAILSVVCCPRSLVARRQALAETPRRAIERVSDRPRTTGNERRTGSSAHALRMLTCQPVFMASIPRFHVNPRGIDGTLVVVQPRFGRTIHGLYTAVHTPIPRRAPERTLVSAARGRSRI